MSSAPIHDFGQNKLKNALYDIVCDTLSTNTDIRRVAEEKIKAMEVTQEHPVHLLELSLDKEVSEEVRQMCSILLKNYVFDYWDEWNDESIRMGRETKLRVRELLILGIQEPNRRIGHTFAHCLAHIGAVELPNNWPGFFEELLANKDEVTLSAYILVLQEIVKMLDTVKVPYSLPVIIERLCDILGNSSKYSSSLLREVVSVVNLIMQMYFTEDFKIRQLIAPRLGHLCQHFTSLLRITDNNVFDYGLKTSVVQFLKLSAECMSKDLAPYLDSVLPVIWGMVMNYGEVYTKSFVYDTSDFMNVEYEGNLIGFSPLVLAIFDLISCIVCSRTLKPFLTNVLKDIIYYNLIFMNITKSQEETWTEDPLIFLEENRRPSHVRSIRQSARDVLMVMCDSFESGVVVPAVCVALNKHLGEVTSAKRNGVCDWWKKHEVCMYALGLIQKLIMPAYETGAFEFNLVHYIDMWQFTFQYPELTLLLGRCMWFGGKYSAIMHISCFNNYLQTTVNCILHSDPIIRTFAIRSILGYVEQFDENPHNQTLLMSFIRIAEGLLNNIEDQTYFQYTFLLSLQTLKEIFLVDKQLLYAVESRLIPLLVNIFMKHHIEPGVIPEIKSLLRLLCNDATCVDNVRTKFLPALLDILNLPNEKSAPGLQAIAMDILQSIIRSSQQPWNDLFFLDTFPIVIKCIIRNEDQMILQNGGECLRSYLTNGAEQVLNYRDSDGKTGLEYILRATSEMLDPANVQYACNHVGKLIITIIKSGSVQGAQINFLLRAILSKMQRVEDPVVWQSLLTVFIYLFYTQTDGVVTFLTSVPGPSGASALDFVLKEWIIRHYSFSGYYEHNLSSLGLTKLLEYSVTSSNKCFDNIIVRYSHGTKDEWTEILALPRAFQLIVKEIVHHIKVRRFEQGDSFSDSGSDVSADPYSLPESDQSDQLFSNDPVFQVDVCNHLTDFINKFKTIPSFHWFASYIPNDHKIVLASVGIYM